MAKRGGLGRGLSALIPGAPESGETSGLLEVPVNAVSPNPKQPRTRFDDDAIGSLASSIREVGILQPIVVRKAGAGYELIAGERRLRAAKVAGLATIPVVVRDTDDADTLREALIENIHREDLGPIELAEAFRQLLEELGLKQEELADRVGVSRSHIANTIRLLQLPIDVQQLLTDGKLQAGHARALLTLGDAEAAAVFLRRFRDRVFGLAMSITRDRVDADDVAQDAFVRAWRYAASLPQPTTPPSQITEAAFPFTPLKSKLPWQ